MDKGPWLFTNTFTSWLSAVGTFSSVVAQLFEWLTSLVLLVVFFIVWYLFATVGTRKTSDIRFHRRSAWGVTYWTSARKDQIINRNIIFILIVNALFLAYLFFYRR